MGSGARYLEKQPRPFVARRYFYREPRRRNDYDFDALCGALCDERTAVGAVFHPCLYGFLLQFDAAMDAFGASLGQEKTLA